MHEKESDLKAHNSKPWYILYPDGSATRARDACLVLALISLALVTPFELAFARPLGGVDFLFCFNRAIDLAFMWDLVLQFFIAKEMVIAPEPLGKRVTPKAKFEQQKQLLGTGKPKMYYEYGLWPIASAYIHGMLAFDLLALVPSMMDIYEVVTFYAEAEASDDDTLKMLRGTKTVKLNRMASMAKMFKMMRAARVMKLFRLMNNIQKFKEIETRLLNSLYRHKRKVTLFKLLLFNSYIVHILACILGYTINFNDDKFTTFWAKHGYCWAYSGNRGIPVSELVWPSATDMGAWPGSLEAPICVGMWTEYMVCYHWALGATLGIDTSGIDQGPGDATGPEIDDGSYYTTPEQVVVMLCGLFGAGWGLYITGIFVNVLTETNDTPTEQVTEYAIGKGLHWATTRGLQEFCEEQEALSQTFPRRDAALYNLSPRLLEDVMLSVHGVWLLKLPFANFLLNPTDVFTSPGKFGIPSKAVEKAAMPFLSKLAQSMQPALFVPTENPPQNRLYVIIKGDAVSLLNGATLKEGDNWGVLDTLLPGQPKARVRALTYLHTCFITPEAIRDIGRDAEMAPAYAHVMKWCIIAQTCRALSRHRKGDGPTRGQVEGVDAVSRSGKLPQSISQSPRLDLEKLSADGGGVGGQAEEGGSHVLVSSLQADVARLQGDVAKLQGQSGELLQQNGEILQQNGEILQLLRHTAGNGSGSGGGQQMAFSHRWQSEMGGDINA